MRLTVQKMYGYEDEGASKRMELIKESIEGDDKEQARKVYEKAKLYFKVEHSFDIVDIAYIGFYCKEVYQETTSEYVIVEFLEDYDLIGGQLEIIEDGEGKFYFEYISEEISLLSEENNSLFIC